MKHSTLTLLLALALAAPPAFAQEPEPAGPTFDAAVEDMQRQLREAVAELERLYETMAAEKLPLARQLADLEAQFTVVRGEYDETMRTLDSRTLDLTNLRAGIKARQEEQTYLSNLLNEYIRNFQSRLHVAELQLHEQQLEEARLAMENPNLPRRDVFAAQAGVVSLSLERLHEALGGVRFEGSAVDPGGMVNRGTFVLVGPAAIFRSADGQHVGTAEQRLGSLEAAQLAFASPEDAAAAAQVVTSGQGHFPLDPTLGNAHKIESTRETLWQHIQKGGPVMVPIFAMAGAALLVALSKWIALLRVRRPAQKRIRTLLDAVGRHDEAAALQAARSIRGPVGEMLRVGVEHIREPRELIEEVMYETVLTTRLKVQRLLPFIAICAASAPLLGLLGTVTGIINTFKLITVFGSGDVKTLSGGISEALITTEFGLIVAIPSLLLHAYLSRKARGVVGQMEMAAVSFINQISKRPYEHTLGLSGGQARLEEEPAVAAAGADGSRDVDRQVKEMVMELLAPMVREGLANGGGSGHGPGRREVSAGSHETTGVGER